MNYQETIQYLYDSVPMFQRVGASAYKSGLENTYALDEHFEHPHRKFHTIHVAGTNGKGSVSHTLAAVLQTAGYKPLHTCLTSVSASVSMVRKSRKNMSSTSWHRRRHSSSPFTLRSSS